MRRVKELRDRKRGEKSRGEERRGVKKRGVYADVNQHNDQNLSGDHALLPQQPRPMEALGKR